MNNYRKNSIIFGGIATGIIVLSRIISSLFLLTHGYFLFVLLPLSIGAGTAMIFYEGFVKGNYKNANTCFWFCIMLGLNTLRSRATIDIAIGITVIVLMVLAMHNLKKYLPNEK